jgi:hypothetical protein
MLDDRATVAARFASVVVCQGDTTREAESKSGEREEFEHHDPGESIRHAVRSPSNFSWL